MDRAVTHLVVAVAFGSNLGHRRRHIQTAAARVSEILADFKLSSIIETVPVGIGLEHDPPYLNAVGVGETSCGARQIFEALRYVEMSAGRERPYPGAPRTLDLDLILAGNGVINEPDLQVPHPRFRDRLFVLGPLAEVAPHLLDPVSGLTIHELRDALVQKEKAGA